MPLTSGHVSVRLELDSRPEALTCVRAMVTGVAESMGVGGELLDDLRTAISEACSNVVLHAYTGDRGPLLVDVEVGAGSVLATVADRGGGILSLSSAQERMRVGIALISALTDRAEFISAPGGGTEVRMAFGGDRSQPPGARFEGAEPRSMSGDVVVHLSRASLLRGVLGRVCTVVAMQAGFTLDRHSDLDLLTDALAAELASAAPDAAIGFSLVSLARWLELTVGSLPVGTTGALLAMGGVAGPSPLSPLARLADELTVECHDGQESIHVLMFDRR